MRLWALFSALGAMGRLWWGYRTRRARKVDETPRSVQMLPVRTPRYHVVVVQDEHGRRLTLVEKGNKRRGWRLRSLRPVHGIPASVLRGLVPMTGPLRPVDLGLDHLIIDNDAGHRILLRADDDLLEKKNIYSALQPENGSTEHGGIEPHQ